MYVKSQLAQGLVNTARYPAVPSVVEIVYDPWVSVKPGSGLIES